MKYLIGVLLILVGVGILVAWNMAHQRSTMADLVEYLHTQGLTITPSVILPGEQQFLDHFKREATKLQKFSKSQSDPDLTPLEVALYDVNGIPRVYFYHFKTQEAAQQFFSEHQVLEEKTRARKLEEHSENSETEYILAGKTFVISIYHFTVSISNGKLDIGSARAIDLPLHDLAQLRQALASWNK